jgi:hypothetical protein
MIYMHLLTWVGFGLIGYVPNTLYRCNIMICVFFRPHQAIIEYHRYKLMYESIQPISGEPVYKMTSQRFTHVTVDVTAAKGIGKQFVAYVASESGDVMKLAILPHFVGACLVEVWKLRDQNGGYNVLTMQFVKETVSRNLFIDSARRWRSHYSCPYPPCISVRVYLVWP